MSQYVKLWTDILGDPKLMSATRKGARELQLLPWLFAFAKAAEDEGRITINGEPADPIDIAALIPRATPKRVMLALEEATALGILTRDEDGALRFTAWERRTGAKPSDAPSEIGKRVRKHREKQRAEKRGDETPCNALHPERCNATETEEETETESETETETESSSSPPDAEASVASRLVTDADRNALTALLVSVPHAEGWLAEMRMMLDGERGPALRPSAAQLGVAISEYVGNGDAARPSLSHFKGYVRRAMQPARPTTVATVTPMRPRSTVATRTFDNAVRALKDLP